MEIRRFRRHSESPNLLGNYYASVGIQVNHQQIIITTGGSEAIQFGFMACLDAGDDEINGEPVSPVPRGMYSPSGTTLTGTFLPANQTAVADPATGGLRIAIATTPGSIKPILNGNPTPVVGVNVPVILYSISDNPQITDQTVGNPDRSPFDDQGTPGVDRPIALPDGTFAFLDRPTGGQSFTSSLQPGQLLPVIIQPAGELDPSNTTDNLNPNYTSSTLLPSSYSVEDAIDKVVECNCECWIT